MARKEIDVASRAYSWSSVTGGPAPWPEFDEKKINEKLIPEDEQYKECEAFIEDGVGHLEWITQACGSPSDQFNEEIIRAFRANGLKIGDVIHVSYSMRGESGMMWYDLTIK